MMSRGRDIDQTLTSWLQEEAGAGSADYVDETLVLLDRTAQRRWRGAVRRAIPIDAMPRLVVPRAVVYLAVVGLLLVALAVAAVLIGSQPRLPPPIGPAWNGLIAYDDGRDVYVAEQDQSNVRAITGGLGLEYNGNFSPDGTLIAFWSSKSGQGGALFVARSDGPEPARQLGPGTLLDGPVHMPPAWSPDSRSITYPAWTPAGPSGIYVTSVETGEARYVAGDGQGAGYPVWSPDGQWIAYRTSFEGRTALRIVHPDGAGSRELVSTEGAVNAFTQIAWSPDSRALVYHRPHEQFVDQSVIAVYDLADGEHVVSSPDRPAQAPTWSPDGSLIAYMVEVPDEGDVFHRELVVATADGRVHRTLGPVADCLALWSPDARFLISYAPGCFNDRIVIVPVGGGSPRMVTLPRNIVGAPSWQRVAESLFGG